MSHKPDYYRTVSLKLSEVLNDIGVNEGMILKRRRMYLLKETMSTCTERLMGRNLSIYHFGSQSEGSTTKGLDSDADTLTCHNERNVIQHWGEWQPDRKSLLMIQDETTSPGYCLLQSLRNDKPLPICTAALDHEPDIYHTVIGDKLLLKNTLYRNVAIEGSVINGPAASMQGLPGFSDQDCVAALHCNSWPAEAQPWLSRQGIGRWPTEDVKRYCENTGCFVVPVSSKNGQHEKLEWRISTSQAERCLMFNLNITQLRCYILMKMILKTRCNGVLSSFMCKTVLFHCIQNTHSNNWVQSNLLPCLMCCLTVLKNCVRQEKCPHFIIHENNLMSGRIFPLDKIMDLETLQNIIQSEGRALLKIRIDDLGTRLMVKMNIDGAFQYHKTPAQIHAQISAQLLLDVAGTVGASHKFLCEKINHDKEYAIVRETLSNIMLTLTKMYREVGFSSLKKSALKLLALPLSSSLGSVIASHNIKTAHSISSEALAWFSAGLNSDVASGKLKLASALYSAGDMERAEFFLRITKEKYDLNTVEPECECYNHPLNDPWQGFMHKFNNGNEELIQQKTAFCVRFLQCEICCVPKELQYEMFRSTQEDKLERDELSDTWMDCAVVDCLPYLYFLQYKTYRALQRLTDQQYALAELDTTIKTESNLGHRETALNLLGQCMVQENRHTDALRYYTRSLNIRARNNAAKFLICILLNEIINHGSYRISETKFKYFSRTFQGLFTNFQGLFSFQNRDLI
ncbi:uncharacterized protein LOC123564127 [Mercenaria mercenaria]|uniref:uncharacterized protein LOC123564127 n=1 Tax=Mercenaria mercenaria TaxID=6596 RepID=UPI00234F6109|nr:uncharacterized protein LOC123564127 [Mercenaria mercenaria]